MGWRDDRQLLTAFGFMFKFHAEYHSRKSQNVKARPLNKSWALRLEITWVRILIIEFDSDVSSQVRKLWKIANKH